MISDRESVAMRCRPGTINNKKRKKLLKAYLVDARNKNKPGHKQIIWGEKSLHKQPDTTSPCSPQPSRNPVASSLAPCVLRAGRQHNYKNRGSKINCFIWRDNLLKLTMTNRGGRRRAGGRPELGRDTNMAQAAACLPPSWLWDNTSIMPATGRKGQSH